MKVNKRLRTLALGTITLALGVGIGRYYPHGENAKLAAHRDSYQFFDTLVDVRSQIERNYVEPVDDDKLLQGAIQGMMGELDPYSNYFAKDELNRFDRAVHGQFSGIGAEIAQDPTTGNFVIVSPLEDSPALKAGIYAGDRITKINGDSVEGMSLKDLLMQVSGTPNTSLKMTVVHEGSKNPEDLTVKRAVIQIHSVRGVRHVENGDWDFLIDTDHRIAYVRITNFMENTADELDKALLPLINDQRNGSLKGIILDLRFNPGGLLQAGIDVSDRFLDSGVIVSTGRPDTSKRDFVAEATKEHTYPRIPTVVLINRWSASASEIVAGALKDHQRAVLIGERSYGKGSVQSLINMDNGNAAMKLTTAYYYLPSGKNIMRKKGATSWGVEPDPAFNIPLSDEENRQVLIDRANSEIIRHVATTVPVAGARTDPEDESTPPAATQPVEASDRQLQRALEILIAYQAFGAGKDFAVNVTTAAPGASHSIPAAPTSAPATQNENGGGRAVTRILGLETTCDETAAAVVEDGRTVLSNIVSSQIDLHAKFGGVVPEVAARAHLESLNAIVAQALEQAHITDPQNQLDAIAVANCPGLIGCLLVGTAAAKGFALAWNKPLIAVNHVQAHLYSVVLHESGQWSVVSGQKKENATDHWPLTTDHYPQFPAIGLVMSGGHSSLYHVQSFSNLQRIGQTLDDAAGEAFDKVAAILHLGYPGGPLIDALAKTGNPHAIKFPLSHLEKDSLNFSFSGLKTAVLYHVNGKKGRERDASSLSPQQKADIAASFQRVAAEMLIEKIRRAAMRFPTRSLLIGGGVSANTAIRGAVQKLGHELNLPVFIPPMRYCTDNAAMIAGLAYPLLQSHHTAGFNLETIATV